MSKRPSFQFYPGDYLRDAGLRSCSVGARGLWMDMICHMHDGNPYGYLKVGGKVILPMVLARMVGASTKEVEAWLQELLEASVYSVDSDGCIYSRRMIRDEEVRAKRALGGVLGGNPVLTHKVGSKVNLNGNHRPTPSVFSLQSSSSDTPKVPEEHAGYRLRLGKIFGRRDSTPWSPKELKSFRQTLPGREGYEDELSSIERFYSLEENPQRPLYRRKELLTLLNNWQGEIDRSRQHGQSKHDRSAI